MTDYTAILWITNDDGTRSILDIMPFRPKCSLDEVMRLINEWYPDQAENIEIRLCDEGAE